MATKRLKNPLSAVEQAFVDYLVENPGLSRTEAACLVIDTHDVREGRRVAGTIMANKSVGLALEAYRVAAVEDVRLHGAAVVKQLQGLSTVDLTSIFDPDTRELQPLNQWSDAVRQSVEQVEIGSTLDGRTVLKGVKFVSKERVLKTLVGAMGLLNPGKIDINAGGDGQGGTVQVLVVNGQEVEF